MPVFQLLRLGRFNWELGLLMAGVFKAMYAVAWAAVLLFIMVYFFAAFMTNIVAHSGLFEGDEALLADFSHLTDSLFTVFVFAVLMDFSDTIRSAT